VKIRVALAGLRFGGAFVPIYRHHPDVEHVGIVDPDRAVLDDLGGKYDVERRAAWWTAAGVCAHQSAMKGGKRVDVPAFE
jgi:predicted dehydrogenase